MLQHHLRDAERWAAFFNWLNENNLLEDKINPGYGFTNDYLPDLYEKIRSKKHK